MTLPLIVRRSLRQHALSTTITALSIALAGGLLMSVWVVKDQSQRTFTQVNTGFDAVLGARGSKLQLVLNSIFHLEASPGNVAAADYQYIKRHPAVKLAIPIAVGDNLRGYRIVGTIPELFTRRGVRARAGISRCRPGRLFDPDAKEAVVGSFAARKLGLCGRRHLPPLPRPRSTTRRTSTRRPTTSPASSRPPTRRPTRWSGSRSTASRR